MTSPQNGYDLEQRSGLFSTESELSIAKLSKKPNFKKFLRGGIIPCANEDRSFI